MKSANLVYVFLLSACMWGCKKDEQVVVPVVVPENFTVGNKSNGVDIHTFSDPIQIFEASRGTTTYKLDINGGGDDFILSSEYGLSPGGIILYIASIKISNTDIQIVVFNNTDSIYKCFATENDTIIRDTYYTKNTGFICDSNGQSELTSTGIKQYSKIYALNDHIDSTELWTGSPLNLCYANQSHFWIPPATYSNYSMLFGNWNQTDKKYLVFKLSAGNQTKYGWLQLSVSNYNKIQLHEYALQK